MRTGVRTGVHEVVRLLVSSGRSRGEEKKAKAKAKKRDVGVRIARDADADGMYDEDGPPGAASAPPSSGGRGPEGSGLTRRSLQPLSPSGWLVTPAAKTRAHLFLERPFRPMREDPWNR